ncbi:MAG: FtsX-like permease family protein [Gemmatimonas sp.]|nr:FtsX-like permease family protein [Gemmatimonas sp.]
MSSGPPPILRRLLTWALPPGRVRDGLSGDLDELYAERVQEGRLHADVWYGRQLLSVLLHYPPRRVCAVWTRRQRVQTMMRGLGKDLRYAFRTVARQPGFAAVIVLTLGLGIGANTAVFSAVDSVLLRPLPYPDADRLVAVWLDGRGEPIGPATYSAVRDGSRTLEDVAAWSGWGFTVTGDGGAEAVQGARISTNLPQMLGVVPLHGRTFVEEEALPWGGPAYAGGNAALLSYGFWQRRYGGDPAVVGRTITIDGMPVPVVGVMPESFDFPSPTAELWTPIAVEPSEEPSAGGAYRLVGRLRDGVSPEDALSEMRGLAGALRNEYPDGFPDRWGEQSEVVPLRDDLVGPTKQTLFILLGAVTFVLLVGCANVANLFLARATGRRSEMAIRTALGAGRWRLVRQLLTEQTVLACLGALLGLILALWGARIFAEALPPDLTGAREIGISGRVLGFTVTLTAVAGLLSGIVPALRTARGELQFTLGEAGRSGTLGRDRHRLLGSLVVTQLAVALVLVVGASLMLQSFWRLSQQDPGFRAEGVLTFRAAAPEAFYPDASQRTQLTAGILERVSALPGVASAGAIHLLPLGGSNWGNALQVESRPLLPGQDGPTVAWRVATPEYFGTVGVPLLAGRGFTPTDRTGAPPVAVISETLARQVFPGDDPLGERVRTGFDGEAWTTIVGVVGDTKDLDLASTTLPQIYRPHAQVSLAGMTYMIRTREDPLSLAGPAREIVADLDANVPVSDVQPMDDVISQSIAEPRFLMLLLGAFGAAGLLLAAVGIYGVISYAVGQRTREFGIRLALGARPADLLYHVLGGGAKLGLLGLLIGISGSALLARFLESVLYEIEPLDGPTFAVVAVVLASVALLGSYVPARRAARVNPVISLSGE